MAKEKETPNVKAVAAAAAPKQKRSIVKYFKDAIQKGSVAVKETGIQQHRRCYRVPGGIGHCNMGA